MKILLLAFLCFICSVDAFASPATPMAYTSTANPLVQIPVTTAVPLPIGVYDGSNNPGYVLTSNGSGSSATFNASGSGAEQTISFQPGLLTAVTNTKGVFGKFVKASTVDNIVASAMLFTCVSNPTITLYECGTDPACATSPVTIGAATVTTSGTAVVGTISNAAISAGDFIAFAISAGTCSSLDISATSQVHAN